MTVPTPSGGQPKVTVAPGGLTELDTFGSKFDLLSLSRLGELAWDANEFLVELNVQGSKVFKQTAKAVETDHVLEKVEACQIETMAVLT